VLEGLRIRFLVLHPSVNNIIEVSTNKITIDYLEEDGLGVLSSCSLIACLAFILCLKEQVSRAQRQIALGAIAKTTQRSQTQNKKLYSGVIINHTRNIINTSTKGESA
jgi:hypothetical protein